MPTGILTLGAMGKHSEQSYRRLIIRASPRTDIWLADDDGHLVQKERGTLDTSLIPGRYVVEFGPGTQTYPIHLVKDSEYSQAEIEDGPSCPRPKVKLAPAYTAKQGQYLAFIYYFTKIHGESPSEAEMQRYFRVTPPSVHQMVLSLEAKGLIARTPVKARSIELLVDRAELPDLE
jgi:repressor LexA